MKRILIDLTDLELWSGHHGGTQRVVYGIASNYYLHQESLDDKVVFIAFSARHKRFYETSFKPIYERVESLKAATPTSVSATPSLKGRLKHGIRPFVPKIVRRNDAAKKMVRGSMKVVRHTVVAVRAGSSSRRLKIGNSSNGQVVFSRNDTVLMLGKPWDDLNIQKKLTEEKSKTNFKLVQVVYDLIIPLYPNLHHPDIFAAYTQHMFEAVATSDLLLPISNSSANDLRKFCKRLSLPIPEIKVIRLGDEIIDIVSKKKPDQRIKEDFIACVGTVEIRKNHTLLFYAYKLGLERGLELPQLVIVGGKGWLTGDLQYILKNDPALKDKIIILNNINDSGLSWIYENCRFTVYPSMYEGWGLPVAESLAHGKMCVASKSSSIPEIAGELIDYFSPYNSEECLNVISRHLDASLVQSKEQAIKAKYGITTWNDTFNFVNKSISSLQTKLD
ncbi:MAG: glycosyltransferase family 1 protein [Patescibacteria group bacterium]